MGGGHGVLSPPHRETADDVAAVVPGEDGPQTAIKLLSCRHTVSERNVNDGGRIIVVLRK